MSLDNPIPDASDPVSAPSAGPSPRSAGSTPAAAVDSAEPVYAQRVPHGICTAADFATWSDHVKRGVEYYYFAARTTDGRTDVPQVTRQLSAELSTLALPRDPSERRASINLVFVHGTGSNRTRLSRVQRTYAAYNRYYPNLPGRQNTPHRGTDSAEDYVDEVCDFISDIPNVVLFGHSLGGALVAGILERHPATVRGAVICGGAFDFNQLPDAFRDALREGRLDTSLAYGKMSAEDELAFDTVGSDPETERVQLQDWIANSHLDFGTPQGRARLAQLDIPVVLVSGRHDYIVPWQKSDELAQAIPEAEHIIVNDIGHMLPMMWPERVRAVVDSLIARI